MARVHILERTQRLAVSRERAFELYSEARNLERIGDRVRYALPLGPLGEIAHAAFVERDLREIFDYREHAVAEWLQAEATRSTA